MLIPLDQLIAAHNLRITGVVHAGAHLGEEADAYQAAGINRVWWIEGNHDLLAPLEQHVYQYPGHYVLWGLLADVDGKPITFKITNNGQSSSIFEFGTHAIVSPDVHFIDKHQMLSVTLDTLADEHEITGCNFLNMDLQGAELLALQGGERLLKAMDALYLEVNVDELYLGCARLPQLDEWLTARGFTRVATAMAGNAGWGDALWVRT